MGDLFHYDFYIKRDIYERIEKVITACPQHTFFMLTKRPNSMNDLVSEIFNKNRIVPNLWVGVSAENQEYAQLRIPQLLEIPAAKHFVSIEPMLGSVDITPFLSGENKLDWVICGQETGTNARPLKEEWFINLYRQCEKFKVPIYVKSPLYESFPKYMNVFQRRDS
jgi:protein gp37